MAKPSPESGSSAKQCDDHRQVIQREYHAGRARRDRHGQSVVSIRQRRDNRRISAGRLGLPRAGIGEIAREFQFGDLWQCDEVVIRRGPLFRSASLQLVQQAFNLRGFNANLDRGLRGHATIWGASYQLPTAFRAQTTSTEIQATIRQHVTDYHTLFNGSGIANFDLYNEHFHEREFVFNKEVSDSTASTLIAEQAAEVAEWFKAAQEADPAAKLFINEYNILNFWQENDSDVIANVLEGAFEHSAVEGVTIWGMRDSRHWRDNAIMWDDSDPNNWILKPSGQAWVDRVKGTWGTEASGATDASGQFSIPVFRGKHVITVTDGNRPISYVVADFTGETDAIEVTLDTTTPDTSSAFLANMGIYVTPPPPTGCGPRVYRRW